MTVERLSPSCSYSLKVVVAVRSVIDPAPHAAGLEIVATELFAQFDVAVNEPPAALDVGFRGIRLPPLTRDAESRGGFRYR
jgi:hypothetical protein